MMRNHNSLMTIVPWLAVVLFYETTWSQTSFQPKQSWSFHVGDGISGAVKWYPSPHTPEYAVVTSSKNAVVSLVDPTGRAVWQTPLHGDCSLPSGIGDLDGDGTPEIVVPMADGQVVALGRGGREIWRYHMKGRLLENRCPAIVDLDRDGSCEVLISDTEGYVACISPMGKRLWTFRIDRYRASPLAVADLDRDGELEIVYCTELDRIVCLNADGSIKWVRHFEGRFGRTAPSLGDVNGDGYLDIAFTKSFNTPSGLLYVISGPTGDLLWSGAIEMWAYASNAIVDLDRDGSAELICGGRSRRVHVFESDGARKWIYTLPNPGFFREPCVADVTGDGDYEIIGTSRHGPGFEVLDADGNYLGCFGEDDCQETPAIADFDRDGKLEILVTQLMKGNLVCYETDSEAKADSVLWSCYRNSSDNTGIGFFPQPADKPFEYEANKPSTLSVALGNPTIWGRNDLLVSEHSPWPSLPVIEISIQSQQGISRHEAFQINADEFPIRIPIVIEYPEKNRIDVKLHDGESGKCIAQTQFDVQVNEKELTHWTETQTQHIRQAAEATAAASPDIAQLIFLLASNQEAGLNALLAAYKSLAEKSDREHDDWVERMMALTQKVNENVTLSQTFLSVPSNTSIPPVLVWEDRNPWDEASEWDSFPQNISTDPLILTVWMYQNEYETRAINLLNVTSEPIEVQVRFDPAFKDYLNFNEAIRVPRHDGTWVTDALAEMNSAQTITLAPGQIRKLYCVVHADQLEPGTHEFPVRLLILSQNNTEIPLTLKAEIIDIDLSSAPMFYLCNWSSVARFRQSHFSDDEFKKENGYGMNVLYVSCPSGECDENGNLVGQTDWSTLDSELDLLTLDCFLFVSLHVKTPPSVKFGDNSWKKAFRAWADRMTDHLAARGFPRTQWAIYPVDEPGLQDGPRIRQLKEYVIPAKAAAPDVQIYANPAGAVTEANFRELLPYIDIWCPELFELLRRPWMIDFFKSDTVARIWCYEAPNFHTNLSPLGYYRSQPLIAFSLGLTGSGYWVHYSSELWRTDSPDYYGANYGMDGIWCRSRRWHATRDGVEDARAYMLLQSLTQQAREAGKAADIRHQAETLLNGDIPRLLEKPKRADDITRFIIDYTPDYDSLLALRKRAAELTLQMRAALHQ